jgi:hypothetical protein
MTHILFERTGGFMGRKVSLRLDLDDLPHDQAGTLKRLLDDSGFFSLPENLITHPIPDEFIYTITTEDDEHHKTVRVSDTTATDALRPLIAELSQRARAR